MVVLKYMFYFAAVAWLAVQGASYAVASFIQPGERGAGDTGLLIPPISGVTSLLIPTEVLLINRDLIFPTEGPLQFLLIRQQILKPLASLALLDNPERTNVQGQRWTAKSIFDGCPQCSEDATENVSA